MTSKITKIESRQILDSRGLPTIETTVYTSKNKGTASVPSGKSTGAHEAKELRDHERAYHGYSVQNAINNVHNILAPKLKGLDVRKQKDLDEKMIILDGTDQKERLGANAILSISLANARCIAQLQKKELYESLGTGKTLPIPFANIINGGKHAENNLQIQEFMIAPVKAKTFSEATQIIAEVYHSLKEIIEKRYGKQAIHIGDEGGFAPPLINPRSALDLLTKAIEENGYQEKTKLALDCAASEFFDRRTQTYEIEPKKQMTREELTEYYIELIKKYPIISLEDPFDQDDFFAYLSFMEAVKGLQIVGDDLLCMNKKRIEEAGNKEFCNALLVKPNQVGTLTETKEAIQLAKRFKWNTMVSHRSGETEDTFIADLAVALETQQIKIGAPCRSERTAKYNRLLEIEEQLGKKGKIGKIE